jgi:[acyl-carrier-protein] S-malonyltransferase
MQKAVPVGVGAMAALLGLEFDQAAAVAAEAAQGQVCQAANDNGGGQVVVSGDKAAVERAVEIAKQKGAKRAMMLTVSAPFHCALMQPAADAMAQALADVTVRAPAVPVVANVIARPVTEPADIRDGALARQRRLHGTAGRHRLLRARHRQGAERLGQADRRRRDRGGHRFAR